MTVVRMEFGGAVQLYQLPEELDDRAHGLSPASSSGHRYGSDWTRPGRSQRERQCSDVCQTGISGSSLARLALMERRTTPRPQRVLIVDDSADIRGLWRLWLTFWGFAVEEAQNGSEALQKAQANPPDLILMDLWMPVLDGLEATTRLKSLPTTAHVPGLALSAQLERPNAAEALAAGAEAFIPKPCDADTLVEHIRAVMGRLRPA